MTIYILSLCLWLVPSSHLSQILIPLFRYTTSRSIHRFHFQNPLFENFSTFLFLPLLISILSNLSTVPFIFFVDHSNTQATTKLDYSNMDTHQSPPGPSSPLFSSNNIHSSTMERSQSCFSPRNGTVSEMGRMKNAS